MKYYGIIAPKIILIYIAMEGTSALSSKTLEQMQDLYKNIGTDLMCIRKEFTGAQPKVYSILDRIDKMYNLAKITAEKKHHLKLQIKNQSGETKKLYAEIDVLKSKIASHEEYIANTHKKLEIVNSELEKEKKQIEQLAQEKTSLSKQQESLNKNKNISDRDKKHSETGDLMREIRSLKGLSEEEKNLLKQAQSLSLSSTSAPSSPL